MSGHPFMATAAIAFVVHCIVTWAFFRASVKDEETIARVVFVVALLQSGIAVLAALLGFTVAR